VTTLEKVLGRVDACQQRLAKIPVLLKRFRQSVLAAACSGRLTADWREEHNCTSIEAELLASIRGNKKLSEALTNGTRFRSSKPFDWDALPDLPKPWCWTAAAEIDADIVYGIVQPGPDVADGIPYVRGLDIQNGQIRTDQLRRTCLAIAKRYERASLSGGDVLLGIIRHTKVAIVPDSLTGGIITQGTARFRPSRFIITGFLATWLKSQFAQEWLHAQYRGIDMPGLNLADVRKLPIPLPPLPEQREIVRRVEALFALADQLEARFTQARTHVDRLPPSLLATAFRGELVPTEAELAEREGRDYEPAWVLLERIRRERASGTAHQSGRPTPRRTRRAS
jgi:type I restriction enzyme, S subunit